MEKEYYYIYCDEILGVKTNIRDFKWIYGSVAPADCVSQYEKCVVKFDVRLKPEKKLNYVRAYDQRFQNYFWNHEHKTISCRRSLFGKFMIGYDINIVDNVVYAEVGEHYYNFVKNRMMNLHGLYYLLSDLANIILLKNGLLTLYASSAYFRPLKKCVVNFAPPNTGKSYTVTQLCNKYDYSFVGEDIIITDGKKVYSCPWTCSYRRKIKKCDNAGSLKRTYREMLDNCKECELTDIAVLSLGEKYVSRDKKEMLKRITVLNGYLFNYYSSPIVKILGYFDEAFYMPWNELSGAILYEMADKCNCFLINADRSSDFAIILHEVICGGYI